MHNPYQAPNASLVSASPPPPGQIKLSVALLAASLLIHTLVPLWLVFANGGASDKHPLAIAMIAFILSADSMLLAVILFFVWLRHNWARWVWLVLALGVWGFALHGLDGRIYPLSPTEMLKLVLQVAGILLLFLGPGARWFKRKEV